MSYQELRDKLQRRFGSDDQQEKFQAELRARRRRKGETLAELCQDVQRLMTMAYPGEGVTKYSTRGRRGRLRLRQRLDWIDTLC